MSTNSFRYPGPITLDSLPDLFAHHRAQTGGWSMTQAAPEGGQQQSQQQSGGDADQQGQQNQPPERPDDISAETWDALGDPGKQAIVRERERANAAERALAASRARPAAPKGNQGGGNGGGQHQGGQQNQNGGQGQQRSGSGDQQPDFAALIQQAVSEAVKPFAEAEERRQTEAAAEKVRQDVLDAAKGRLHDATDALSNLDLAAVVGEDGRADAGKVRSALDDLVTRKPHLAKTTTRQAPPGIGGGAPANVTEADKVKAALAEMQKATGVRPPAPAQTGTS